jgi:CHAT domain-containing protein
VTDFIKFDCFRRHKSWAGTIVFFCILFLVNCSEKQPSGKLVKKPIVNQTNSDYKKNNKEEPLSILYDSGVFYSKRGHYEKAISYFKQAEQFNKNTSNWEEYIKTINYLGYNYVLLYKQDSAYFYLNRALKLALEKIPACNDILARVYCNFGLYYCFNYYPDKSVDSYNKALEFWNYEPSDAYFCYYSLGNFYLFALKDYKKAEEYFIKAQKIQETPKYYVPEELGNCYYNIGIVNQKMGDYVKADSYLRQALALYSLTKDFSNLERVFSALGILQVDMEKYDEAADNFNKALNLNIDNNGDLVMRGYHFTNIGYVYSINGQLDKAIKHYKAAIPLLGSNDIMSVTGLTNAYMYIAQVYQKLQKTDQTLYFINKCKDISTNFFGAKHTKVFEANQFLGKYYEEKKLYDSALYYYQSAIIASVQGFNDRNIYMNPKFNQVSFSSSIYEVLASKADVFMQMYRNNMSSRSYLFSAYNCFKLCDSLIAVRKQLLEYDNSKLKFTQLCHNVYEKYLNCVYELYSINKSVTYISDAFDIMEKNKATLLQNSVMQAEAINNIGIPDSIRKNLEELNKKIIYLDQLVLEENDIPLKDSVQKQLFDFRRKQEKLKEYIENKYPIYFQYKYHPNQISLKLFQFMLNQKQQLIEYFQGDSSIFGISVDKRGSIFCKITHDQELDSLISTFRHTISTNPEFDDININYHLFTESSYKLYKILIVPLIDYNNAFTTNQLIIVPDGIFSFIPFEALLNANPDKNTVDFRRLAYLIKSFSISYGYSANLFFNKTSDPKVKNSKILSFGISGKYRGLDKERAVSLIGSITELNEIKKSMKSVFYVDKDATEYNFKSQAPFYKIIHLALHGSADIKNANNCKIFFTSGGKVHEDGILYDYELYALKLNSSLAVLTACETGLGKYYKGEGVFSMARGFIYAGCPSVVMSYWKLNDQVTAQITSCFYQHLKHGELVHQALRNAKLEYLNRADNITAHPVNWASLNAWGKADVKVAKLSNGYFYLILGGGLVLIFLIFKRRFIKF